MAWRQLQSEGEGARGADDGLPRTQDKPVRGARGGRGTAERAQRNADVLLSHIATVLRHGKEEELAETALGMFRNLTVTIDETGGDRIVSVHGLLESLELASQRHIASTMVQLYFWGVVANLAVPSSPVRLRVGLVTRGVAGAAAHVEHKDVQRQFLKAVTNLAHDCSVRHVLGMHAGVRSQLVAGAMAHVQHKEVQMPFLSAVFQLAATDEVRHELGMDEGVRRQLLAVAAAHSADADMLRSLLCAIGALIQDPDVQERLNDTIRRQAGFGLNRFLFLIMSRFM